MGLVSFLLEFSLYQLPVFISVTLWQEKMEQKGETFCTVLGKFDWTFLFLEALSSSQQFLMQGCGFPVKVN